MFYCVGNWKLNKTPQEATNFIEILLKEAAPAELENLVLLPPALCAAAVASAAKNGLRWGGQNCYFENSGAFTGENSAKTFKALGGQFCLAGHSERRLLFVEPDEMIGKKVAAIQQADLIPILCVGETLDDRKWRRTNEVIGRQLKMGVAVADKSKPLWVAYEPVWAIGTGEIATPDLVQEAHSFLREQLFSIFGVQKGAEIPLLYGGSVKSDTSPPLRALNNVNGFLIGGASLDPLEFLKIYRAKR